MKPNRNFNLGDNVSIDSLSTCRSYASMDIFSARICYGVSKYNEDLLARIDDICLEMGYLCKDDKPKHEKLAGRLTIQVYALTKEESERSKLFKYVNAIKRIGVDYLYLDPPSPSREQNVKTEEKKEKAEPVAVSDKPEQYKLPKSGWPNARIMIHQPMIGGVITGQATDLEIQSEKIS